MVLFSCRNRSTEHWAVLICFFFFFSDGWFTIHSETIAKLFTFGWLFGKLFAKFDGSKPWHNVETTL
jgi:hypothetical protein